MLHHAAGIGGSQQLVVDLVSLERLAADGCFLLLAHGGPNVGDEDIRPLGRFQGIAGQVKVLPLGKGQHLGIRVVPLRAGHRDGHPRLEAAHNQGIGHVVPVPDVAQMQPRQGLFVFPDGHQVGQHLAGMAEIGETVDNGDRAVFRQLLHLALGKGADHDAVQVPGQHPGSVLNGLAPANLQILGAEEEGGSPQLIHPHLKGHPGAGGGLGKDHPQALSPQDGVGNLVGLFVFQPVGQIQQGDDFFPRQVQQLEQMVHPWFLPCRFPVQ